MLCIVFFNHTRYWLESKFMLQFIYCMFTSFIFKNELRFLNFRASFKISSVLC